MPQEPNPDLHNNQPESRWVGLCKVCGQVMLARRSDKWVCTPRCRKTKSRRAAQPAAPDWHLPRQPRQLEPDPIPTSRAGGEGYREYATPPNLAARRDADLHPRKPFVPRAKVRY